MRFIFNSYRLENDGHFARAAAVALFNLELRKAIEILSKGACSRNYKGSFYISTVFSSMLIFLEV